MDKELKKIPAEQLQIEDSADNASRSEHEENDRADISPPASMSSSSLTLWITTMISQADLKKVKQKKPNNSPPSYQDHLKYRFLATVANSKPCFKGILCLELFATDCK